MEASAVVCLPLRPPRPCQPENSWKKQNTTPDIDRAVRCAVRAVRADPSTGGCQISVIVSSLGGCCQLGLEELGVPLGCVCDEPARSRCGVCVWPRARFMVAIMWPALKSRARGASASILAVRALPGAGQWISRQVPCHKKGKELQPRPRLAACAWDAHRRPKHQYEGGKGERGSKGGRRGAGSAVAHQRDNLGPPRSRGAQPGGLQFWSTSPLCAIRNPAGPMRREQFSCGGAFEPPIAGWGGLERGSRGRAHIKGQC